MIWQIQKPSKEVQLVVRIKYLYGRETVRIDEITHHVRFTGDIVKIYCITPIYRSAIYQRPIGQCKIYFTY